MAKPKRKTQASHGRKPVKKRKAVRIDHHVPTTPDHEIESQPSTPSNTTPTKTEPDIPPQPAESPLRTAIILWLLPLLLFIIIAILKWIFR